MSRTNPLHSELLGSWPAQRIRKNKKDPRRFVQAFFEALGLCFLRLFFSSWSLCYHFAWNEQVILKGHSSDALDSNAYLPRECDPDPNKSRVELRQPILDTKLCQHRLDWTNIQSYRSGILNPFGNHKQTCLDAIRDILIALQTWSQMQLVMTWFLNQVVFVMNINE